MNLENYRTINQAHAHESVSNRYGFVSTKQVLEVLQDHHWKVTNVQEMDVRRYSRAGFQKHLVHLEYTGFDRQLQQVGDVLPRLSVLNAHDKSSQFEFLLGLLRKVCMNGLYVADQTVQSQKIRHIGYTAEKVAIALQQIVTDAPKAIESIARFQAIQLNDREQTAFATSAVELVNDGEKFAMRPSDLLAARRSDDRKSDLWTTFNRIQENVIRGGVTRTTKDGKSRRTRQVKSIDRNVDLNRALWALTERMAELKAN